MDKYKHIMNDWNYGASSTVISFLVLDLEYFKCFTLFIYIFVVYFNNTSINLDYIMSSERVISEG
jgi:hypothetical protein